MVIVKIRASVKRLSEHATVNSFSMPLDELRLKESAEAGKVDSKGVYIVKPLLINHNPEITPIKPQSTYIVNSQLLRMRPVAFICPC